jgi:hypothetical protein
LLEEDKSKENYLTHLGWRVPGMIRLGNAFPTSLVHAEDILHPMSDLFFWHFRKA